MTIQPATAFSAAAGGIPAAQRRLDHDVQAIARDPFDVDSLVDAELAPLAVQANAAVFRAADSTTHRLFDGYA